MTLAEVQERAKQLSTSDRMRLLDWLWQEVEGLDLADVQSRWALESEERIDAVDRGELPTVHGPTALRALRDSLKR
jgi:hypothetical protein